jgi:cytidine deaminase
MKKLDLNIFLYEYNADELDKFDIQLLEKAKQACQTAYAPYSNFYVGAAIMLADGTIILGSNQENAAYPSGLCAERTAVFAAGANYPKQQIMTIAVAAYKKDTLGFISVAPCGACRQALLEYEVKQETPIRLIMQSENNKIYISPSISNMLPVQFSIHQLK